MKGQLYSGMWISLPFSVKIQIAEMFQIPRSGATHVVNNDVVSDGFLDTDLAKVNTETLQKHLSSTETDFFKLWSELVDIVTGVVEPKKVSPAKEEKPVLSDEIKAAIKKTRQNAKKGEADKPETQQA